MNDIHFYYFHLQVTALCLRQPLTEVKCNESRSVVSDSLQPHGLYSPWNSPGWNTGVGSLYQLSLKGSPRMLEWVAYSFSRGSSQPRNRTGVSCIAGRFFTN